MLFRAKRQAWHSAVRFDRHLWRSAIAVRFCHGFNHRREIQEARASVECPTPVNASDPCSDALRPATGMCAQVIKERARRRPWGRWRMMTGHAHFEHIEDGEEQQT
jgi:hypothetical protein